MVLSWSEYGQYDVSRSGTFTWNDLGPAVEITSPGIHWSVELHEKFLMNIKSPTINERWRAVLSWYCFCFSCFSSTLICKSGFNRSNGLLSLWPINTSSAGVVPVVLWGVFQSVSKPGFNLCLGVFYRPPSSASTIFDSLFETLITVDQSYFSNFVLLGDFNINYFCITHPLYHHLCNLENSFSLTQVVDSPTRFSSSLSSDLLLILCFYLIFTLFLSVVLFLHLLTLII